MNCLCIRQEKSLEWKFSGYLSATQDSNTSRFVGNLRLEYIDGYNWRLLEPFSFVDVVGDVHTSPAGSITNFASTPRFLWPLLPPTGSYGAAAVIHDFLVGSKTVSRDKADAIFLEMLIVLGINPFERWVLYRGVRIGTWWSKHGVFK